MLIETLLNQGANYFNQVFAGNGPAVQGNMQQMTDSALLVLKVRPYNPLLWPAVVKLYVQSTCFSCSSLIALQRGVLQQQPAAVATACRRVNQCSCYTPAQSFKQQHCPCYGAFAGAVLAGTVRLVRFSGAGIQEVASSQHLPGGLAQVRNHSVAVPATYWTSST